MRQIPLAIGPVVVPTFDNYLPGPNLAAQSHLAGLVGPSGLPVEPAAPVYLWGSAGTGKTHLLRALTERCQAAGQSVAWFDAADRQPWLWAADWSLVVIDRCERLDAAGQQAAFALFVEAAAQGTQMACAGRVPPVDLPLRDDLRSRMAWGHVLALRPLTDAETRAVLRREADRRGVLLPDEVLNYVLSRFERDLGYLMRMLDALDEFALVRARHITVPLVRAMLAEQGLDERATQ